MKESNIQPSKIAFLDRDGTLIYEPKDTKRIDKLSQLKILPGVVSGLKALINQGYRLIMISNQDGLGAKSFPFKVFQKVQKALLKMFKEPGIEFERIFVCPHLEEDKCGCRKPKIGLVKKFFKEQSIDYKKSFMVGDRNTDGKFAENIGVKFYKMETNSNFPRIGSVERATKETRIFVQANLDGRGGFEIDTGIKFFDHMLEQISKHSLVDLIIKAQGDLQVDEHHTVEDVGLTFGQALSSALGERKGIKRYGFLLPMDEALAEVAVDLGGRPYLVFNCKFSREKVGDLPTELAEDFFRAVSEGLKANIHINLKYGRNDHHKTESLFKAFAKALRQAVESDPRQRGILPSTKGMI